MYKILRTAYPKEYAWTTALNTIMKRMGHGLIKSIILKNLPIKGLCGRGFAEFID
jgi:hypothetical protein